MSGVSAFKKKIRSQKSRGWFFILPVYLSSTLFWVCAAALVPVLALLGGLPGLIAAAVLAALIARPLYHAFGPILAPRTYLQNQLGVELVTDDPRYAALVAEVNTMARAAGLKEVRHVGISRDEFNAFAFGFSRSQSAVVLGDELLRNLNREQVRSVIGHEIGHLVSGDTKLSTMLMTSDLTYRKGILQPISKIAGYLGITFLAVGEPTYRHRESGVVNLVFQLIGLCFLLISSVVWILGRITLFFIEIIRSYHSRRREHRADVVGALLTSRASMVNALLALENAGTVRQPPDPFATLKVINHASGGTFRFFGLLDTHPKTRKRIEFLELFEGFDRSPE